MPQPGIIVFGDEEISSYLGKLSTLIANQFIKAVDGQTVKNSISLFEAEDGTVKIGSLSNYVQISPNGHITLLGDATVYDDLLGDVTKLKVVGVGITEDTIESAVSFLTSANLSDYLYVNYQLSHTWKPGSNLGPHLHMEQTQINVPNMLIQYRWQINGGLKQTSWTNYKCNTPVFTYISGTLNQIFKGSGIIPPVGYNISDILQIRILRDNNNASGLFAGIDPYTTNILLTSGDIHFEKNDLGSNTEYDK